MFSLRYVSIFISKFFGFYEMPNGEMWEYDDKLGYGNFIDERHILWIAIIMVLSIFLYQFCEKDKQKGKKIIKILMIIMLIVRIILQIVKTIVGYSLPHGRDLIPGQMCTILIYLLPLTVIFNWKKINTPVYVLSMMGGFMTFLMGDYFTSRFLSFYTLEGIWAHTMLWVIPIAMIGLGEFKLEWKKIWQVIVMMLIMLAWAMFLNKIVFKKYNSNYFYLENNMLPGNMGGKYFFLLYVIIFFVLLLSIYGIPKLYKKISKTLIKENEKLKKQITIIIVIGIIIMSQILMIYVKEHRETKFSEEEKSINLAILTTMLSDFSIDYSEEQIQKRLDNILGENEANVYKSLTGMKVKFLETGNVYNIRNSKANIKAVKISQIIHKYLTYILESILVINLIISTTIIYKNNRKANEINKKC